MLKLKVRGGEEYHNGQKAAERLWVWVSQPFNVCENENFAETMERRSMN